MSTLPSPSEANDATGQTAIPTGADKHARWKWLLRLVLGLVIVGVLLSRLDSADTRRLLQELSWPLLLKVLPVAIVVYLASQAISAMRWRLLLNVLLDKSAARLPVIECVRLYLLGMFWSLWMPTSIGGDAVRAYMAGRRYGGVGLAASSIFTERLMGFCTLLCIGTVGLFIGRVGQAQQQSAFSLARQGLVFLLAAVLFLFAIRALAFRLERRKPDHPVMRKWAEIHRTLDMYAHRERWSALGTAILLSLVVQGMQISLNIGLARVVGLDLPVETFLWLVPLLAVASMIPLGIGGLGVREASATLLLKGSGVPDARILVWSLLWQATIWLSGLCGGLLASGRMGNRDEEVEA